MFRKLLCVVLVLGLAGTAYATPYAYSGFNTGEQAPSYVVGNLTGQGSAGNGWTGPWAGSDSYKVVEGGCTHPAPANHAGDPDNHVVLSAMDGTKSIDRGLVSFSSDYSIEMCTDPLGVPSTSTWANQFQVQLRDSAGKRGLHIKYENGPDHQFRLNADASDMLDYMTGGLHAGAGGTILVNPLKGAANYDWIHWRVDYTAATTNYALYWEDITGAMEYVGSHLGPKDVGTFNGTVASLHLEGPKALTTGAGIAFDRILITPEPASMLLLGAGVALLRRRRA
jgi:hypothetical protein